jgi:hypothetical protein
VLLRLAAARFPLLSPKVAVQSHGLGAFVYELAFGNCARSTAPIVPKKHVGALQRGRKLTRAGLLTRYQSFLVQELETVSWNLYGERDYAKHTVFFDDAVRARCTSTDRCLPFFDERSLPTRARAVLKSLEIDTDSAENRA